MYVYTYKSRGIETERERVRHTNMGRERMRGRRGTRVCRVRNGSCTGE